MPFHIGSASIFSVRPSGIAPRAICLLSGGPDGAVAAALVKRSGYVLSALTVDYGQRTAAKELECAGRTAAWLGVDEHRNTRLSWLSEVAAATPLLSTSAQLNGSNPGSEYVPFRNTLLLALAVAWAETAQAGAVVIGSIGAGSSTPDNSPEYIAAIQNVVTLGTHCAGIEVLAPLASSGKSDCISQGLALDVPFEMTWSCHNDTQIACGICANCRARLDAFAAAEAADPLPYQRRSTARG